MYNSVLCPNLAIGGDTKQPEIQSATGAFFSSLRRKSAHFQHISGKVQHKRLLQINNLYRFSVSSVYYIDSWPEALCRPCWRIRVWLKGVMFKKEYLGAETPAGADSTHAEPDLPHAIERFDHTRWVVYTVVHEPRVCQQPMWADGKTVTEYLAPRITEYVDLSTGEIAPASNVEFRGVRPIRFSEMVLQRAYVLEKCIRSELKPFARFVLRFRNFRRGVTPGLLTLARWYAELTGKNPSDVRRYVKRLREAGITGDGDLMAPLFQMTSRKLTARDHLQESGRAHMDYAYLWMRKAYEVPRERARPNTGWKASSTSVIRQRKESLPPAYQLPQISLSAKSSAFG